MVRHGLLHGNEQTNDVNIYASPVPPFKLGEILPLFHGVPCEDVVHRFLDTEKYGGAGVLQLTQMLQRPHAKGMLSCAFWLCILLEFRATRKLQTYNPDSTVGVDDEYCDRLMLNLSFHYALFSAECEAQLTGTVDDGSVRFAFFGKFAKLVIFSMTQLCSANVHEIESSAKSIECAVLYWTLGIDVTSDLDKTSTNVTQLCSTNVSATVSATQQSDGTSGEPGGGFRSVTGRDLKLRKYREFCDDGRSKKGTGAQMIAVVMGEAPTRMPLYARSTATKKGVGGGESAEVVRPETILRDVRLENMVKSLEDELAEARRREEEQSRLDLEKQQSASAGTTLGNLWQETPFASVGRLGSGSVTPLMKIFLESCSIQSQHSLLASTTDLSSLQRSNYSPVSLMTTKIERLHARKSLPTCKQHHEMSVAVGEAVCCRCANKASTAHRYLVCDFCSEVLCRSCAGKEVSVAARTLPSAADVFGREAANAECVYKPPLNTEQTSLVRKIVADRCSSGLVRLINTVNRQRKQPSNLFDMQVQHATWVGHQADNCLDSAIQEAADAALRLPQNAQASVASSALNCAGTVAPVHRWRPQSAGGVATSQSRPHSAMSRIATPSPTPSPALRPASASLLGAFLTGDHSLGQSARQEETLVSSPARAARPGSAVSGGAAQLRRSVSTPSLLLRPQSAQSSAARQSSLLHISTRPNEPPIAWSRLQTTEVQLLDDKRARMQAAKRHILERVKIINTQSAAATEAQKEFTRHVVREEARNSLECFQDSKAALRKLRLREKNTVATAADEVVEAMEATTLRLHGLDEIDCIKTALIAINKHFEVLPENVRKHATSFAGRYKPKLLYLIREYKMQYRDRSLWPASLEDPNRTRAMDQQQRSSPPLSAEARVKSEAPPEVERFPVNQTEHDEEADEDSASTVDARATIESMLAAQSHDVDAERRLLNEKYRREAALKHERHIQELAGIEVKAIGQGLVVAGGQVLWADSNRSVGAEAAEVRSRYITNKLYR